MSNPLAEAARSARLEVCGRIVDRYEPGVPPAAPPDDSLRQNAPRGVAQILGQLTRRGLQPSLVAALRAEWSERPLERSLLAWDTLNGSLLPDALAEELRDEARLVGAVLPAAGGSYIVRRPKEIDQLITAMAVPALEGWSTEALTAGDPPLGGLRVGGVASDQTLLELTRQYARLLHRAHLPALASFRLADLYFNHRFEPALRDLVEVLLDQQSPDVESWMADASARDASTIELATYARVRSLNNCDQWDEALTFAATHLAALQSMNLTPDQAARINPRPTLAYAEAALRAGRQTVSFEHVAAIAGLESPWRYAFRVLLTYSATRIKDASFVKLLATDLEKFGNDLRAWYDPMAVAPDDVHWGRGFLALLAREGETLPHNPEVWKAAALLLGSDDASDGVDEVDLRLRKQASLV